MYVEQMYTGCLAEAAYYIESGGEAAVIDPLRETEPYIRKAEERGAKIKYVFETHFHADFVSGHIDLAKKSGATIIFGPEAEMGFDARVAEDGEIFKIGDIKIKVLHTPGHTPESSTYLLIDEKEKNHAIFTGDTLFIGDVGRPDLAVKSDMTKEDLAGMLYESLRNKIMPLEDDVIVYPGHGAGSACGKNMSSETISTLGEQKKCNYALGDMSKEEFIAEVTEGILPPPQYFPKNALLNKQGYNSIDDVMEQGVRPLSVEDFEKEMSNDALVLDTRHQQIFNKSFIPGSVFIGLDGSFATWVGALIEDLNQTILIVADEGREEEAVRRLARVGYDNSIGFLKGGFDAWKNAGKDTDEIESIPASELATLAQQQKLNIVDVRKPDEFEAEHVENAISYPLDFINGHLDDLNKSKKYYLHCKSGYRSMIASSILRKNGFEDVIDVAGGFQAISETDLPRTDYVCPTTTA